MCRARRSTPTIAKTIRKQKTPKKAKNGGSTAYESQLWQVADALRGSTQPSRSSVDGGGRFHRANPYSGEEGYMSLHRNASADPRFDSPLRLWIAIWLRELVYRQG